MLQERQEAIFTARKEKLVRARENRKEQHQTELLTL